MPRKTPSLGDQDHTSLPARSKIGPEELPPEEWDFRRIREDQLDAAIYYEYARSCGWVLEVFKRWHETRFRSQSRKAKVHKWHGRTIAEILARPEHEQLPSEVEEWCEKKTPAEFETQGLQRLINISPDFPELFLKLKSPETFFAREPRLQECPSCWEDLGRGAIPGGRWLNLPFDEDEHEGTFLRRVLVDLRFAKTTIESDFAKLLDKLDDGRVEKLNMATGAKAARPWFRLKELAAYRLATKTDIKFANVRAFVWAHRSTSLLDNFGVLPDYGQGGFSDAVKSAAHYIQERFPTPHKSPPS